MVDRPSVIMPNPSINKLCIHTNAQRANARSLRSTNLHACEHARAYASIIINDRRDCVIGRFSAIRMAGSFVCTIPIYRARTPVTWCARAVFPFSFFSADDARDVHVHVHVYIRWSWVWIGVACGRAGGPLVDLGIVSCLERALDLR